MSARNTSRDEIILRVWDLGRLVDKTNYIMLSSYDPNLEPEQELLGKLAFGDG